MKLRLLTALLTVAVSIGCSGGSSGGSGESATTTASSTSLGSFSSGPDLNSPRGQHTATLLPDGRVLVSGGTDGRGLLADSEVFDPLTNTWGLVRQLSTNPNDGLMMDATGRFPTARQLHTASLLDDGRVLIAGGVGIERVDANGTPILETLRSAYTFDYRTNRFQRVGDLNSPRAWHQASAVNGGRAIIAGGLDASLRSQTTAEVFDPAQNRFFLVNMASAHTWGSMFRSGADALLVGGANVTQDAQGGWTIASLPSSRTERATAAGAFAPLADAGAHRVNMGSVATPEGAFFAGGQAAVGAGLQAVSTTERYLAGENAFVAGPALREARFGSRVARVGASPDLLVIGGVGASGQQLRSCELYNAAQGTIVGSVDMLTPRSDFTAVTLRDGRILVVGGLDGQAPAMGIVQTEFHTR